MKIEKVTFRNIGSYGNKEQEIKFSPNGSLNLVVGKNGAGKCVHPDTGISIQIMNSDIEDKFKEFQKRRKSS